MLFNNTRQYNMEIFDKFIFFKYRTRELKATILFNTMWQITSGFDYPALRCFVVLTNMFCRSGMQEMQSGTMISSVTKPYA